MTLLSFAADLARMQAANLKHFTPHEDPTERAVQNFLRVIDDFRDARGEALQWDDVSRREARLAQLKDRMVAILGLAMEEGQQLKAALEPARCYVSAADYDAHDFTEGA